MCADREGDADQKWEFPFVLLVIIKMFFAVLKEALDF